MTVGAVAEDQGQPVLANLRIALGTDRECRDLFIVELKPDLGRWLLRQVFGAHEAGVEPPATRILHKIGARVGADEVKRDRLQDGALASSVFAKDQQCLRNAFGRVWCSR